MDLKLDSTLESVEKAEKMVREAARQHGVDEDDVERLGLAVHECMVNAVVHGNKYNRNKKVHLSIERQEDRLTVIIVDQGEGFDPQKLPDPLAEENLLRNSGRGLLLMKAFVDEFDLRPVDPAGTQVTLVKYLDQK